MRNNQEKHPEPAALELNHRVVCDLLLAQNGNCVFTLSQKL
jgi:hypothetical protein